MFNCPDTWNVCNVCGKIVHVYRISKHENSAIHKKWLKIQEEERQISLSNK